jgi:hypothetical protein
MKMIALAVVYVKMPALIRQLPSSKAKNRKGKGGAL